MRKADLSFIHFLTVLDNVGLFLLAGCLAEAHDLMVDSINLFHQVYGPLHGDIATCYR